MIFFGLYIDLISFIFVFFCNNIKLYDTKKTFEKNHDLNERAKREEKKKRKS